MELRRFGCVTVKIASRVCTGSLLVVFKHDHSALAMSRLLKLNPVRPSMYLTLRNSVDQTFLLEIVIDNPGAMTYEKNHIKITSNGKYFLLIFPEDDDVEAIFKELEEAYLKSCISPSKNKIYGFRSRKRRAEARPQNEQEKQSENEDIVLLDSVKDNIQAIIAELSAKCKSKKFGSEEGVMKLMQYYALLKNNQIYSGIGLIRAVLLNLLKLNDWSIYNRLFAVTEIEDVFEILSGPKLPPRDDRVYRQRQELILNIIPENEFGLSNLFLQILIMKTIRKKILVNLHANDALFLIELFLKDLVEKVIASLINEIERFKIHVNIGLDPEHHVEVCCGLVHLLRLVFRTDLFFRENTIFTLMTQTELVSVLLMPTLAPGLSTVHAKLFYYLTRCNPILMRKVFATNPNFPEKISSLLQVEGQGKIFSLLIKTFRILLLHVRLDDDGGDLAEFDNNFFGLYLARIVRFVGPIIESGQIYDPNDNNIFIDNTERKKIIIEEVFSLLCICIEEFPGFVYPLVIEFNFPLFAMNMFRCEFFTLRVSTFSLIKAVAKQELFREYFASKLAVPLQKLSAEYDANGEILLAKSIKYALNDFFKTR